jgi:hypothetical protein
MAGIVISTSVSHNLAVQAAEGVRQVAVATAAGNRSAINSAEVTFYRTIVRSGIANNVGVSGAMQALRELGVTGL